MADFVLAHCIADGQLHALLTHLKPVDLSKHTKLCRIMTDAGSDKGADKHNYAAVYEELFCGRDITRLFEVGLGTNYLDVPSNMGADGRPGASLRGWREFFPDADIFGADIDRRILFSEPSIETFYVDQRSPRAISDMWTEIGLHDFDVIIDDGLHEFEANRMFFEHSIRHLKKDGLFIIEDILCTRSNIEAFEAFLRQTGHEFALLVLPHPTNGTDNCLAIVQKTVLDSRTKVVFEAGFWSTVEALQPLLRLRETQLRRKKARVARHAMIKRYVPRAILSLLKQASVDLEWVRRGPHSG
jgi:hypothetical protein